MSIPPPPPIERPSLYPEPHRAGDWTEPPRPQRKPWAVLMIAAVAVALLLTAIVNLGLSVGRTKGTEAVSVTDPNGVSMNALQVQVGTCLKDVPGDGKVSRVVAVPCTVPHHAEVVASFRFQGDTWPGREAVESDMLAHCGSFIQPGFDPDSMFTTSDWEDGLRWVAWIPTEGSWDIGERTGVCVVYREGDIVGSFIKGTASFSN